jgi:hypothetical protein
MDRQTHIPNLRANVHQPNAEAKVPWIEHVGKHESRGQYLSAKNSIKPSVRIERSWNRKKIPGLRCSSESFDAFAQSGPTNVLVYVCLGRGIDRPG